MFVRMARFIMCFMKCLNCIWGYRAWVEVYFSPYVVIWLVREKGRPHIQMPKLCGFTSDITMGDLRVAKSTLLLQKQIDCCDDTFIT